MESKLNTQKNHWNNVIHKVGNLFLVWNLMAGQTVWLKEMYCVMAEGLQ